MIDSSGALRSVVRHAAQGGEIDYDEIVSTVDALTDSGDLTLVPRLHEALDRFLDEENDYGRDLIAGVLAGITGVAALPASLLAAARDLGDDQDGLQSQINGLVDADPASSRSVMLDLVRSDAPEQRRAGLLAFGAVAGPGDVGLLAEAATDVDPDVRLMAIEAIPNPAGDDREFLVAALHDPHAQVRLAAIGRLGSIGRLDAVAQLAAVAADPAPRVRARVAYAFGRLGSPAATPALRRLLDDADPHVRDQARDALGAVGGPDAVDALLGEAVDPDPRRRAQAAKALAKAVDSDPRVAPRLTLMARDDEAAVRAATLSGLATVADTSSADTTSRWAPIVTELADDPDPTVRQRVGVVARHLAPNQVGDILRRLADDPAATVRQVATTQVDRLSQ